MFPIKYSLLCAFYFRILIDNDPPQLSILRCCNHCYPLIFLLVFALQFIYIYALDIVTCCLCLSLAFSMSWACHILQGPFSHYMSRKFQCSFFLCSFCSQFPERKKLAEISRKKETNKTNKMLLKQKMKKNIKGKKQKRN